MSLNNVSTEANPSKKHKKQKKEIPPSGISSLDLMSQNTSEDRQITAE